MRVSDYGVKEVWTVKAKFLALFGIRIVRAVNSHHQFEIAIVGVPPWRSLNSNDLYVKKCYELQ